MNTRKITSPNYEERLIRNLMCAVLFRAVEDYCGECSETDKRIMSPSFFDRDVIISDLKSPRLVALTDGMSLTVASQLEHNAFDIKNRLRTMTTDYQKGDNNDKRPIKK